MVGPWWSATSIYGEYLEKTHMTLEEKKHLEPAIRLATGFEMAAYREMVIESMQEDKKNLPESKKLAEEYNIALDIFALYFSEDIQ